MPSFHRAAVALLVGLVAFAQGQYQVAIIVGGVDNTIGEFRVLEDAEIFGCPGTNRGIRIADFPGRAQQLGGIHFHDPEGVLVCGGWVCLPGEDCGVSDKCYIWNPKVSDEWRGGLVADLPRARWNYLMAHGPIIDDPTSTETENPITIGYWVETDIYDRREATKNWTQYKNAPDTWFGCLVQDHWGNDEIYHIGESVTKIDVTTWEISDIGSVPGAIQNPGKCSPAVVDGEPGIFTRFGFFFRFSDQKWQVRAQPPLDSLGRFPNSMWEFNQRPTIFGHPVCNIVGQCQNSEVIQYIEEDNVWMSLGFMAQDRVNHLVTTVGVEYCDYFNTTTPAPSTTTSTTTTSKTTPVTTTVTFPPTTSTTTTATEATTAKTTESSASRSVFNGFAILSIAFMLKSLFLI